MSPKSKVSKENLTVVLCNIHLVVIVHMLLRNACLKFYKSADIEITQDKCTILRKRKVYLSELFLNGDLASDISSKRIKPHYS